jgi:hypothetical protein
VPAIFPRWTNKIPLIAGIGVPAAATAAIAAIWYWWSPAYTDAGYQPKQPVRFSHALHAGDVGLDCRYCHNTVEEAAHAAIPPAQTCMNCHSQVLTDAPQLEGVRRAYDGGQPLEWVRVHMLPDYVFFDHSPHVAAGVGCMSCHGRVDTMEVVAQDQPLSMGWCLDCHREDYEDHLRPLDRVTDMTWNPAVETYDYKTDPNRSRKELNPPVHCSGCHR